MNKAEFDQAITRIARETGYPIAAVQSILNKAGRAGIIFIPPGPPKSIGEAETADANDAVEIRI
jgi:hypothetical protein